MSSDGWNTLPLGSLVEINARSISSNFDHDEIEYIDTSSVTRNQFEPTRIVTLAEAPSRAKRRVRDGDTIISTVRPIQQHFGFVRNPKPNTIVSTGFAVVTPIDIHPEFLFYYLSQDTVTNYLNAIAETTTSTYPAFRPNTLAEMEVTIPQKKEKQQRIANILSALDDKIELNRQTNLSLEAIAQAIFKAWFVDFNFPGAMGDMVGRVVGMIPQGWRVEPLDEIADFLNGIALQKFPPENEDDYLPVIKIRELKNGVITSSDKASTNIPGKYVIDDGDLIFSWSGTLVVKFWVGGKGALNQHLFKVTSMRYPLWFCYFWLLHHLAEFERIVKDKTTTMGHIKRGHLSEALCKVPPQEQLEKMGLVIDPILQNFILNEQESQTLSALRDTLLPKLMSGDIEV